MSRDVAPLRRSGLTTPTPGKHTPLAFPSGDRLDSWKEIAAYLKRDVRTLHRWERREELPVHRHLHNKRATVWAYKGELELWRDGRRPQRPAIGSPLLDPRGVAASSQRIRLAVLPFQNLSGRPEHEYFSDGFTEEMISQLGRLATEQLAIIARTSVVQYKGTRKSIDQIGRELDVNYVLEGSVRRARHRLSITARLIRVRDQSHAWAESYERELRDVLGLQSDVARAIADEIKIKLPLDVRTRLANPRVVNPESYEAYLKGVFHRNKFTREGFQKALTYLDHAVKKDPRDPLPWAGLALAHAMASHSDLPARQPRQAFAHVKRAAMKALELDDTLAEGHVALAELKLYYEWDWHGAERAFTRALELNPNMAEAHRHYGWYLLLMGRPEEGLTELKRAKEVEPIAPLYTAELGWFHLALGQFDNAKDEALKSLELDPEFPVGLFVIGFVALQEGRCNDAIAAQRRAVATSRGWKWALGYTYAVAGRAHEARQMLAQVGARTKPKDAWDAYTLACVASGLGENDLALEALEAAFEHRHGWMPWIGLVPIFDVLHSESRFQELVRRLKLPN